MNAQNRASKIEQTREPMPPPFIVRLAAAIDRFWVLIVIASIAMCLLLPLVMFDGVFSERQLLAVVCLMCAAPSISVAAVLLVQSKVPLSHLARYADLPGLASRLKLATTAFTWRDILNAVERQCEVERLERQRASLKSAKQA